MFTYVTTPFPIDMMAVLGSLGMWVKPSNTSNRASYRNLACWGRISWTVSSTSYTSYKGQSSNPITVYKVSWQCHVLSKQPETSILKYILAYKWYTKGIILLSGGQCSCIVKLLLAQGYVIFMDNWFHKNAAQFIAWGNKFVGKVNEHWCRTNTDEIHSSPQANPRI